MRHELGINGQWTKEATQEGGKPLPRGSAGNCPTRWTPYSMQQTTPKKGTQSKSGFGAPEEAHALPTHCWPQRAGNPNVKSFKCEEVFLSRGQRLPPNQRQDGAGSHAPEHPGPPTPSEQLLSISLNSDGPGSNPTSCPTSCVISSCVSPLILSTLILFSCTRGKILTFLPVGILPGPQRGFGFVIIYVYILCVTITYNYIRYI